jgi:hypothetical protein
MAQHRNFRTRLSADKAAERHQNGGFLAKIQFQKTFAEFKWGDFSPMLIDRITWP